MEILNQNITNRLVTKKHSILLNQFHKSAIQTLFDAERFMNSGYITNNINIELYR